MFKLMLYIYIVKFGLSVCVYVYLCVWVYVCVYVRCGVVARDIPFERPQLT